MNRVTLNKAHRYVGIGVAPFLALQTVTGLLLKTGMVDRGAPGEAPWGVETVNGSLARFLAKVHFGPGLVNDGYHLLLGSGIIWMAVSGWLLYLRGRRIRARGAGLPGPGGAA